MLGFTLFETLLFLKQLGLAVAGATALWGFVFYMKWRRKQSETEQCYRALAQKLFIPYIISLTFVIVSWIAIHVLFPMTSRAHEGIIVSAEHFEIYRAFQFTTPALIVLALFTLLHLFFYRVYREAMMRYLGIFYAIEFSGVAYIISFSAWVGAFTTEQWFYIGHSVHSIFTIGTVITLDILYTLSRIHAKFAKHIYPLFPSISKVIWVGLGIDFLSVALIFNQSPSLFTPKFYFMQTVVAILIINGIFLSTSVTKKMISALKDFPPYPNKKWSRIAIISGAISICSWTTITFVDTFHNLTIGYLAFLGCYITLIAIAIPVYSQLDKLLPKQ